LFESGHVSEYGRYRQAFSAGASVGLAESLADNTTRSDQSQRRQQAALGKKRQPSRNRLNANGNAPNATRPTVIPMPEVNAMPRTPTAVTSTK